MTGRKYVLHCDRFQNTPTHNTVNIVKKFVTIFAGTMTVSSWLTTNT